MAAADVDTTMKVREEDYSNIVQNRGKSKKKQMKSMILSRFGCFRLDDESPTAEMKNQDVSIDMVSAGALEHPTDPTHLIVMVNGIIGSEQDKILLCNGSRNSVELIDRVPFLFVSIMRY